MDTVKGTHEEGVAPADSANAEKADLKTTPYSRALGERIKLCRGEVSREAFAKELGVHPNTIGKFERGISMPDAAALVQIASLGERSSQWLLEGEGAQASALGIVPKSLNAVEMGLYVYVPHFDVLASAGDGFFNDVESVVAMRPFEASYVRHTLGITHDEIAMINIKGRSMEPRLNSGDVILLDRRDRGALEGDHVIRLDGMLYVKTLQRLPGRVLRVSSRNAEFAPFEITPDEDNQRDFEVIGRLRWAGITLN